MKSLTMKCFCKNSLKYLLLLFLSLTSVNKPKNEAIPLLDSTLLYCNSVIPVIYDNEIYLNA